MLLVFGVATFVGAWLVFLVQPMVAKMVLPLFGGTPAVWNTAMVFFQATLLLGYGYAHLATRWLGLRRQPLVHLAVLAIPVTLLPLAVPAGWAPPADAPPAAWLLGILVVAAGAPYFAVTTASPLLQRWFSATDHPQARDPYFLYAAGNAGSLLALLSYPVLVEPHLSLAGQSRLWAGGYLAFVALSAACVALLSRRRGTPATTTETEAAPASPPLSWPTRLQWIAFAFIPSSLFLGATQFMSTDIAAVPLLWVLPLSVYLLTFILAFARLSRPLVTAATWTLPFLVVGLAATFLGVISLPVWQLFLLHLVVLFFVGSLAHGRLAEERPPPAQLTEFFLLLATGGVLGGVFNALVAPVVFTQVLEYPLVITAALLLRPAAGRRPGLLPPRLRVVEDVVLVVLLHRFVVRLVPDYQAIGGALGVGGLVVVAGLAAGAVYLLATRPLALTVAVAVLLGSAVITNAPTLHADRTFFGVYRVYEDAHARHVLLHGTTIHGFESLAPDLAGVPLSYHHPDGPLGDLYAALDGDPRLDNVAVVGLGVGTMAAYGQTGQRYTFYEIDPAVADVATDPALFTYLRDSDADIDVVLGDGRLTLADTADRYGLIFLNAFTSDAVPVHLLTREAMALYTDRLQPGGLLVYNVTNRYLDIEAVVGGVAADLGLAAIARWDPDRDDAAGRFPSHWVVVARDRADFAALLDDDRWYELDPRTPRPVWTDDFSNILSVYDWAS